MLGLWIFLIVLVICITVIVCKFLENVDVSIWDVKKGMREINTRLDFIARDISRIEKGGVANERIHRQAD